MRVDLTIETSCIIIKKNWAKIERNLMLMNMTKSLPKFLWWSLFSLKKIYNYNVRFNLLHNSIDFITSNILLS